MSGAWSKSEAGREWHRQYYRSNRAKAKDAARRNRTTEKWRAARKAAGLKANDGWSRIREVAKSRAKRGKEYWPEGCRLPKPVALSVKVEKPRKPWNERGLSDAAKYRLRYRCDAAFAQRERDRVSARRFLKPEYGAQWEKHQGRWLRAMGGCDGSIDAALLRSIRSETHCAYCGEPVPARRRHIDHVWPLAKGGRHAADNLVMACAPCNRKKRDKLPLQWMLGIIAGPSGESPMRVFRSPLSF